MNKDELTYDLKKHIVAELNLEETKPEDIVTGAPLFGEGLGLDSIDALELVVLMEKYYQVRIPDEETGRKVLYSVETMADYILENQPA